MIEKLVYVDTDVSLGTPGAEIDDGAALIFLLRQKGVRVVSAGSVFGNAPVRDTSLNLDRLAHLAGWSTHPCRDSVLRDLSLLTLIGLIAGSPGMEKPLRGNSGLLQPLQQT